MCLLLLQALRAVAFNTVFNFHSQSDSIDMGYVSLCCTQPYRGARRRVDSQVDMVGIIRPGRRNSAGAAGTGSLHADMRGIQRSKLGGMIANVRALCHMGPDVSRWGIHVEHELVCKLSARLASCALPVDRTTRSAVGIAGVVVVVVVSSIKRSAHASHVLRSGRRSRVHSLRFRVQGLGSRVLAESRDALHAQETRVYHAVARCGKLHRHVGRGTWQASVAQVALALPRTLGCCSIRHSSGKSHRWQLHWSNRRSIDRIRWSTLR